MKVSDTYRFLPAIPANAELISQLILENTDQVKANPYTDQQKQSWKRANSPQSIREKLTSREVFCCWEGKELLGVIGLKKQEVVGLYVHPAHLRKGVGQYLLNKLESYAASDGIQSLYLFSTPAGYPFYLRNGYEPAGEVDVIVEGVVFRETKMHKRLS